MAPGLPLTSWLVVIFVSCDLVAIASNPVFSNLVNQCCGGDQLPAQKHQKYQLRQSLLKLVNSPHKRQSFIHVYTTIIPELKAPHVISSLRRQQVAVSRNSHQATSEHKWLACCPRKVKIALPMRQRYFHPPLIAEEGTCQNPKIRLKYVLLGSMLASQTGLRRLYQNKNLLSNNEEVATSDFSKRSNTWLGNSCCLPDAARQGTTRRKRSSPNENWKVYFLGCRKVPRKRCRCCRRKKKRRHLISAGLFNSCRKQNNSSHLIRLSDKAKKKSNNRRQAAMSPCISSDDVGNVSDEMRRIAFDELSMPVTQRITTEALRTSSLEDLRKVSDTTKSSKKVTCGARRKLGAHDPMGDCVRGHSEENSTRSEINRGLKPQRPLVQSLLSYLHKELVGQLAKQGSFRSTTQRQTSVTMQTTRGEEQEDTEVNEEKIENSDEDQVAERSSKAVRIPPTTTLKTDFQEYSEQHLNNQITSDEVSSERNPALLHCSRDPEVPGSRPIWKTLVKVPRKKMKKWKSVKGLFSRPLLAPSLLQISPPVACHKDNQITQKTDRQRQFKLSREEEYPARASDEDQQARLKELKMYMRMKAARKKSNRAKARFLKPKCFNRFKANRKESKSLDAQRPDRFDIVCGSNSRTSYCPWVYEDEQRRPMTTAGHINSNHQETQSSNQLQHCADNHIEDDIVRDMNLDGHVVHQDEIYEKDGFQYPLGNVGELHQSIEAQGSNCPDPKSYDMTEVIYDLQNADVATTMNAIDTAKGTQETNLCQLEENFSGDQLPDGAWHHQLCPLLKAWLLNSDCIHQSQMKNKAQDDLTLGFAERCKLKQLLASKMIEHEKELRHRAFHPKFLLETSSYIPNPVNPEINEEAEHFIMPKQKHGHCGVNQEQSNQVRRTDVEAQGTLGNNNLQQYTSNLQVENKIAERSLSSGAGSKSASIREYLRYPPPDVSSTELSDRSYCPPDLSIGITTQTEDHRAEQLGESRETTKKNTALQMSWDVDRPVPSGESSIGQQRKRSQEESFGEITSEPPEVIHQQIALDDLCHDAVQWVSSHDNNNQTIKKQSEDGLNNGISSKSPNQANAIRKKDTSPKHRFPICTHTAIASAVTRRYKASSTPNLQVRKTPFLVMATKSGRRLVKQETSSHVTKKAAKLSTAVWTSTAGKRSTLIYNVVKVTDLEKHIPKWTLGGRRQNQGGTTGQAAARKASSIRTTTAANARGGQS